MKFSLPTATILFCATTALALPQTNSFNDIVAREEDGLDLSNVDIIDVAYDAADFDTAELTARATQHCSNDGNIKRVKPEYKGKCAPTNSKGFASAHNCKNKSGRSYLCVQNKKATCYVGFILPVAAFLADQTASDCLHRRHEEFRERRVLHL
jgi:hypothetical protein